MNMEENNFKTGTVMDMVNNTKTYKADTESIETASEAKYVSEAVEGNIANNNPMSMFHRTRTIVREYRKIGRNDPCPCGSGKKYKNCCLASGKYENLHELTPLEMAKVKEGEMRPDEITQTA